MRTHEWSLPVRLVLAVGMAALFGALLYWNAESMSDAFDAAPLGTSDAHIEMGLFAGPIVAAFWFFSGWKARVVAAVALLGVMFATFDLMVRLICRIC